MATWALALLLPLLYFSGCGSGTDEISFVCTNQGPGDQVCAATSGADVDGNINPPEPSGTPRR